MMRGLTLSVLAAAWLVACATPLPTPSARQQHADMLTAARGWQTVHLQAGRFELVARTPPPLPPRERLTVYIEGDGLAWLSRRMPSSDPTPRDPVALALALAQPDGHAVHLARPCQYVDAAQSGCPRRYWTDARFAAEAVDAIDQAIDQLKLRHGARTLVLVGYSGGGAMAALVAARRDDVARLITVAGNLDHAAWTAHHRLTPLAASLDAAAVADRLRDLPQLHLVGGRDLTLPRALPERWPAGFIGARGEHLHVIESFDHRCCWAAHWPDLYAAADDSAALRRVLTGLQPAQAAVDQERMLSAGDD